MSLLTGLFSKKKKLSRSEVGELFSTVTAEREPIIITSNTFKFVSDIMDYDQRVFHLKNTLTRDEVLYQLKGNQIHVQIPYQLTLYAGATTLMGLGMIRNLHTLKFMIPEELHQEEHRGAYRVSNFSEPPSVTFTTDDYEIIKARLKDVSMTGAGIRLDPRWGMANARLRPRTSIMLDIRISPALSIATNGVIRYIDKGKMGVQFKDLQRDIKEKLFKYVVAKRREAQRELIKNHRKLSPQSSPREGEEAPRAEPKPSGKPTALVVGEQQTLLDFLGATLGRKFDMLYSTTSITDIRNHLELKPTLCLIELQTNKPELISQMRKVSTILPPRCVLMYYGRRFTDSFRDRFLTSGYTEDMLVELGGNTKKLLIFKQIQKYYEDKSPR